MDDRRQRLYRTDVVILKRQDYGEADRLLTVFTPDRGKLRLLAKGVRKIQSRKAGHVELFTHAHLLVARGRTFHIVSQAETIEAFRGMRGDLLRIGAAHYVAEVLDRFTQEEDENRELWGLLVETLDRLADDDEPSLVLRYYELHLLALSGYQPQLHFCVSCGNPLEEVANYFSPMDGGMLCPRCGEAKSAALPLELPAFKVLRFVQTRPWDEVSRLQLRPALLAQVESVLQRYMVFILERNLNSTGFLHSIQRGVAA